MAITIYTNEPKLDEQLIPQDSAHVVIDSRSPAQIAQDAAQQHSINQAARVRYAIRRLIGENELRKRKQEKQAMRNRKRAR